MHGFQDVVERHSKLDQDVLIAWLRLSAECRAATTRLHRTRIIDWFLDHLLKVGAVDSNAITVLCDACNISSARSGVAQSGKAFAELRRLQPFGSVLGGVMAEHVALMRNRGYKYISQSERLLRFDHFLQWNPALQDEPIGVMLEHWRRRKPRAIML